MLTSPVFLPELLGWWHGAPLLQALHELGVPLGTAAAFGCRRCSDRCAAASRSMPGAGTAGCGRRIAWPRSDSLSRIFCLMLGNALMKSTLVVLCGETMSTDDPRREGAYTYYYLGISVGAMLSGVAVGSAAQAFGWHFGFAVAACGMSVALASYVLLAPRWLGAIGLCPDGRAPGGGRMADRCPGRRKECRGRSAPAHRYSVRAGRVAVRVQRRDGSSSLEAGCCSSRKTSIGRSARSSFRCPGSPRSMRRW